MTTPTERYTALVRAEEFLTTLLYSTKTPKIPKIIREKARLVLRHYPTQYELALIARGNSMLLQDPEPLGAKPGRHLVPLSDEPIKLIPKKSKKTKRLRYYKVTKERLAGNMFDPDINKCVNKVFKTIRKSQRKNSKTTK